MARQHCSKETKDLLIDSAIKNFLEKGYSKTTLEDIVKGVGLTRGAFYWNFSTKKDLLDEVVHRYEQFYTDIYENIVYYDSAYETMRKFLINNIRKKMVPNVYTTIIRYKVEACQEVQDLHDRQEKLDKMALEIIGREIERGQQQGEFINTQSAKMLSMLIFSFLLGVDTYNSVHGYAVEGFEEIDDTQVEKYVELILKMIT